MALSAGSIAFTGFNGDGNDNLSFVALTNIAAGTVINFTDSNWNGTGFSNTESVFTWTATTAVAAGTVIDIDNIKAANTSTVSTTGTIAWTNTTNPGLSNDSEVVFAYVGTPGPTTFLAAISNVGYSTSEGTLTGTGLVAGTTAVSFTGGLDIVAYNGSRSGQSDFSNYLSAINNPANWITQDGSGDQSADGTLPNAPFPTAVFTVAAPVVQTISFSPSSVSVAEGNSGTQTLTFTVTRSGGTTGAVSFSGTFGAGTTNAADFGGTLPGSTFNGIIAAGATSVTVTIAISGDTTAEGDESFNLTLTSVSNPSATVAIGTAGATGTITNDDGTIISSNSSTAITLVNNDHVTIASGVTLSGSTPVTWNGGSTSPGALLDNFGTISGTDRGVYTTKSAVSGSLTIHNEAGAIITAVSDAVKIANLASGTNGVVTINNEGTIKSTGTGGAGGQALDLDAVASSGASSVINNASTGLIQAADADAIRGGTNATINNHGQIISKNGSASSTGNDAIDFQTVNTGGVVNNFADGSITGARHAITGDQPITVTNAGTITGQAGSGINMDSAANTTTTVTNSGTITGTSVGGADADGIDVDGLVAIDNSGTIKAIGLVTGGSLNEALAIGGGTVTNHVGGLIVSDQRAITVDDSNNGSAFAAITITNEGTIQGGNGEAISIAGTFADTITNKGTITGSVAMGGGDDTFNDYTGSSVSGPIDGGAGNDIINLLGTGEGTLGATANVEVVKLTSGSWTVTADSSAEIDFQSGSQTLRIGAAAVADGHLDQTIKGFGSGDVIDVKNIGLATTATLGPNNVLTITGDTATVTLQLDPSQSFAGMQFAVAADGSGGTQVTVGSDTTAPTLVSSTPADNAIAVSPAASIVLTFSETVKAGIGSITLTNGAGDVRTISIADTTQITISGNTVTINPTADLWGGRAYDVVVPAGAITDSAGNAYAGIALDGLDFATGPVIIPGVTAATAYSIAAPGNYLLEEGATRTFTAASTANVVATVTAAGSSTTIEIDGHLVSATPGARGIQVSLVNGTVNIGDHGLIQATDNDALQYKGGVVSVNNLGEIVTLNSDGSINPDMVQGIGNGATGVALNFKNAHGATGAVDHSSGGIINNGSVDNDSALIRSDIGDAVELGTNMTLNNYGTISGNGFINDKATNNAFKNPPTDSSNQYSFTSRGVEFQDASHTTVNNWGTITGAQHGVDASSSSSKDLAVNNYGTIVGKNGSGIGSDTIAAAADNFVVTNYGTIIGQYAGPGNVIDTSGQYSVDGDGDGVDIDGGATVINYGNIIGAGASGYDNSGRLNHSEGLSLGGGIVDNHGVIEGADYGITVNNDSNAGNSRSGSTATTITNEVDGTITGDTGYAIRLENKTGTAADNDSIVNYGTIVGNGDIPDVNGVTLRQDGTPDGGSVGTLDGVTYSGSGSTRFISGDGSAIQMGEGDDTLSNYGLIFGSNGRAINMEGGNDTLNVNAGSAIVGLINGGAGNDTINLIGADGGALGTTVNVENLNVRSGTWTVADSQNFTNIDIAGGATVTGMLVNGTDHLVVEAGGRIDGEGNLGWVSDSSNVVVDNAGTIIGLSSDFITTTASITVNNAASGMIAHGIQFYGDLHGGTVTLDNYGSIVGDPSVSYMAIKFEDLLGGDAKIVNHAGGIIAAAAFQDTIRAGRTTTIENAGTIQSYADDAVNGVTGGDGIDFRSNNGGVVHNLAGGLIEGSHHGVTGKKGVTVVNDAGGTIIGRNGSAVNFDNDVSVANTVYVTNHGTLQGKSAGYADSDGDAIDADGLLHLDNDGLIQGLGANGYHNGEVNISEGIAIGGGVINNFAGGTIYGYGRGIEVDNSSLGNAPAATTIYNEGTIQGDGHGPAGVLPADAAAVNLVGSEAINIIGSFADTITNKGTIIGGVAMGGGDDTFNAYTGSSVSGPIDGGDGNDTVNLLGGGTGALGATVNFENLVVEQGAWSVADSESFRNITIKGGATVTSTVEAAVGQAVHLVVEQGGAITSNTTAVVAGDLQGGAFTIDNAGSIAGIVISTNGTNTYAVNNAVGGTISDGVGAGGDLGSGSFTLINDGTIIGSTEFGKQAVATESLRNGTATIVNHAGGLITTVADTDIIRAGSAMTVKNYGAIQSIADDNGRTGGDAVDFRKNSGGVVHNYAGGLIEGSHHAVTGKKGITVINDAGGVMIGRNGSAVNMDNDASPVNTAYITNHGEMDGKSAGYDDSDGDAIDVDGLIQLDNYGLVRGLGANGTHDGGANVSEGVAIGGGVINNYAGATIYGYGRAIQVDDSANGSALAATTIYNEGTIQGDGHGPQNFEEGSDAGIMIAGREAIDILGSFADTITNKGTIIGGVFTDGGDDTFNAYTGSSVSGLIDGGDGNDTIHLLGAGTGTLGATTNFEKLDVDAGTWEVADTTSFQTIEVGSGATLAGTVRFTGSQHLVIDAGGKVDATTDGVSARVFGVLDNAVIDNSGTLYGVLTEGRPSGSVSLINREGGLITGGDSSPGSLIAFGRTTATVDNAGTILGSETTSTVALDFEVSTAKLVNRAGGLITTVAYADVIRGGTGTVIDNFGTVRSGNDERIVNPDDPTDVSIIWGGDAIAFKNKAGGIVHNYGGGLIEGSHHAVSGKLGMTVINDAGGTMIGRNGSAVNVDNDASEANTVHVTNHGTMQGKSAGYDDSDGDAIDTDGLLHLDNYGIIQGLGANGYHNGEVNVSEGVAIGGGVINNYAGATIYGYGRGIEVDDSSLGAAPGATTVYNEGTIQGDGHGPTGVDPADAAAVNLAGSEAINIVGSFDVTIANKGTIIGGVAMGGGDDTLTNTGSITATGGSAIDMGDGDDIVILGAGSSVSGLIKLGAGDDTMTSDTQAVTVDAGSGNDHIVGGAGNDVIHGGEGDDTLVGGTGNDMLFGDAGNNSLAGGDDNDTIFGGASNDHIEGDRGNDTLIGGNGSDVYVYASGDGSDSIVESVGLSGDTDQLVFTDIDATGMTLYKHGNDLDIVLQDGSEILVKHQFGGGGIENISFGDGTVFDKAAIAADLTDRGPVVTGNVVLAAVSEDAPSFTISFADLLAKASDADLDTLTVSAVGHFAGGTATVGANGIIITLDPNYNGPIAFDYTVDDGRGGTAQAHASFDVTPVDDAPVVVTPVAVTTNEDTPATGQILATDVDGDTLTYSIKGDGAGHGTVTIDDHGNWSYTPAANYNGGDSFIVSVSDGHTVVDTTVSLTVAPVNDAPVVVNPVAVTINEDTPVTGHIAATDVDGDTLIYSIKGDGAGHGIVTIDDHGNWSYTPSANYNGGDGFIVSVSDGHAVVDSTVSLTVNPVNDAPHAVNDAATVGENDSALFNLTGNDTDVEDGTPSLTGFHVTGVDGIALTPEQVSSAFSIVSGQLQYTPGSLFDSLNDGQHATVSISYTAEDSGHASTTGQFTLTVNGVTDVNVINGTDGADTLTGTSGIDRITAGDGNDNIYSGAGDDIIDAGKGDDYVFAAAGNKTVDGGEGNDYLFGGAGNSVLNGGTGNDHITGGAGNETINGGDGNDTLMGGAGNDVITGGQGNDLLYGGAGCDTFVFKAGDGHDTVFDFQATGASHDVVQLDSHVFADFAALMQSGAVHDVAGGVHIDYADGSSMALAGVMKASLTVDDFRFA